MKAKIFVIDFPMFDDVAEMMKGAFEDLFDKPCCEKKAPRWTPPTRPACNAPAPEWGIAGKPADENKRFGAGFNVDEPVWDGSESRSSFLEKREAFDEFVDAGERCAELGMCHDDDTPITKCQAVRKPIGTPPVMDKELIGESQFPWWEMGCGW